MPVKYIVEYIKERKKERESKHIGLHLFFFFTCPRKGRGRGDSNL